MDTARGRQHSMKSYKTSTSSHNHHHENSYNASSNHGIFRTSKIQRHNLQWRKDHYYRGNLRSKVAYRKNDLNSRKSNKSTEDAEEEERKKKLNDTAKKLLSKIKKWNAETNCSEDKPQQKCSLNQIVCENICKLTDDKINAEGKPKRIAHSKKAKLVKSRAPKSFSQPSKTITRYEVNKETVKDFQNRIQHKLIEEIMQMPKENLQNVLNDPKINPIMELKMSRLVRENKPLIAQKLRALAESKMKSLDYPMNPQLLVDIDKLIDPVIETDLSVLPYELIKQMENVFQVQFDYSYNNLDPQIESGLPNSALVTVKAEEDCVVEIKSPTQNVKVEENNEDLSLYECSTDEDEEVSASKSFSYDKKFDLMAQVKILPETREAVEKLTSAQVHSKRENNKRKLSDSEPSIEGDKEKKLYRLESENISVTESYEGSPENPIPSQYVGHQLTMKEFSSVSCQTDCSLKEILTDTQCHFTKVESLYGVPLPKETTDENASSLLEEVNSIQNLINKLNERRLMIFLQLAKMNPSGSFVRDEITKKNFIETISNGNLYLVESLKQFFRDQHLKCRSNENKKKSPDKFTGRNNIRNSKKDK